MDEGTETGWVGPQGEIVGESAPESVQNLMAAKKWTNISQIADGYTELEKFKGIGDENRLTLPEGDDPEAWGEVYNRLGRPETYDGYEFENDTGVEISDELFDKFKQFAHQEGYTQKQLAGAVRFQLEAVKAQQELAMQAENEAIENNIKALKEKFGEVEYKAKVAIARTTAEKLGIYKTLEAKGLASDVDMIVMLDNIENKTGEDMISSQAQADAGQKTIEEELAAIQKSEAWLNKFDRKHKEAHARFLELCQLVGEKNVRQA